MTMETIWPCNSKHHGILHRKYVLRCCDKCPSIVLPIQEANKDTTNMCPIIRFHVYRNVSRCTVHGRSPYQKWTTYSLCYTVMISDRTAKVYTQKELVLTGSRPRRHHFYTHSNLSKLKSCKSIISTYFSLIFIFKWCMEQFSLWIVSWAKCFIFISWLYSKLTYSFVAIIFSAFSNNADFHFYFFRDLTILG